MTVVPSTQCHISDDLYLQTHLYDNLRSYTFNAYYLVVIQFECMYSPNVSNLETFIFKFMTLIPGNLGFKIHFSCETAYCSTFIWLEYNYYIKKCSHKFQKCKDGIQQNHQKRGTGGMSKKGPHRYHVNGKDAVIWVIQISVLGHAQY